MKYLIITIFFLTQFAAVAQTGKASNYKNDKTIKIQWVDNLPGDFSFAKKWSYPEGIYKNEFGQLSCDGFCPEEVYAMMDSSGKVYKDSLASFYKIVDTAHQFYSLKADAWCYEYAGTDFIECYDIASYECYSLVNAATHCRLEFSFDDKYCSPYVSLDGISDNKRTIFDCTGGTIKIERQSFKKGVLKAVFDFKFKNTTEPKKPIYWKGKIFTKIIVPNE